MMSYLPRKNANGSIIITVLLITSFFSIIIFSLMSYANANVVRSKGRILSLQAQYAAESGADQAIAMLNSGDESYAGTLNDVLLLDNNGQYRATYSVSVSEGASGKEKKLVATGKVYTPSSALEPSYTRTIEVFAERSSTTFASSMVSRNILEIDSSVKQVKGKDLTINGYIRMNKNVNELIAENIIVADKLSGIGGCSISGSGKLIKPSSFTNPEQTKTKLFLAYNNCINPPGNTSNANFDVLANQTNIPKLQSLYIPWSQFMDDSYESSPSGCNDWSSNLSVLNIPSGINNKQTHYPDSESNISINCGVSGNINLASKTINIHQNTHLRADLCRTSACTPTFNNPSADTKYVFIEGTVNFNQITTSPGSGPIVFIVYGADPASKTSVCPLGGAVFLGNSGTTNAPKLYILGMNGICLDKTRFGAQPALGGIAGKNLYISTNSGTPFDLGFDINFPVNEIPLDLAWRASQYRRL